jgi:hypothetical protein
MMNVTKTYHWTITNKETGQKIELVRDVCTQHPDWVHEQCGSSSEVELQLMLDQLSVADFIGIGADVCGIDIDEESR